MYNYGLLKLASRSSNGNQRLLSKSSHYSMRNLIHLKLSKYLFLHHHKGVRILQQLKMFKTQQYQTLGLLVIFALGP